MAYILKNQKKMECILFLNKIKIHKLSFWNITTTIESKQNENWDDWIIKLYFVGLLE